MKLPFTKMHGCGNDYIYINCFDIEVNSPESLSVVLSDRHTGIGGDGIVLILPSSVADARMRMFNIDGSEGRMCGNAIRCVAKYLYDNGIVQNERMRIETKSGIRELFLSIKNGSVFSVKVDMGQPELNPNNIPVSLPGESVIARAATIGGKEYEITCVSMGSPHAVVFCDNLDDINFSAIGPLFENDAIFPDRINTEFVIAESRNRLKIRVWERGSGETRACGTGSCASVVAAVLNGYCDKDTDIKAQLPGGELIINYTGDTVYMTGNCIKVFDGTVDIDTQLEKEDLHEN